MEGSNEKGSNIERISFAQQGMAENAQFSVAIAIGIFGILTMFLMINHPGILDSEKPGEKEELDLNFGNSFWTKGLWTMVYGIILSAAYWVLVLFGFQSYVARRLFEGLLMGYYMKDMHKDITRIAAENRLANWMVKRIWASNYERKDRYKHLLPVMILYFGITFLLWFFVAIF